MNRYREDDIDALGWFIWGAIKLLVAVCALSLIIYLGAF